jgi:hypothetical protein
VGLVGKLDFGGGLGGGKDDGEQEEGGLFHGAGL